MFVDKEITAFTHYKKHPVLTFEHGNVIAFLSKETNCQTDKAAPSKQLDRKWDGGGREGVSGVEKGGERGRISNSPLSRLLL